MKYAIPLILSCSLLVACQSSERMKLANTRKGAPDFIVGVCGECHAVTANGVSPIADAPEFGDIANTPGLTRETLEAFLSDAHNYPMQMDLDLDRRPYHGHAIGEAYEATLLICHCFAYRIVKRQVLFRHALQSS